MIITMVATGSLNTISATLQLARPARNKIGELKYFEHYYVQTLFMMLGETMCMLAYMLLKWYHKDHPEKVDGEAKSMNPLVMWPAACMDLVATSLGYMGLAWMRNAGFFQMLRATPMIWCGLLSMPILKLRLKWFNWFGILVIVLGLVIKALPYTSPKIYGAPENFGDEWHDNCVNAMTKFQNETNLPPWGPWTPLNIKENESGESCGKSCRMSVGAGMVVVGEFFHGLQFVYEQKYMMKYDLHPLKVVGYEGIFGVLTLSVLLWPMYFVKFGSNEGLLDGIALGPEYRLEDAIDAFGMIFNANKGYSTVNENNGWLLAWTLGNMFSIAAFNWSGITVLKQTNAPTRAVLDQLRIIFIWVTFLPSYDYLCSVKDFFHWTAPIGLVILVCGIWIYNDVIIMPLIRKLRGESPKDKKDEEEDE